VKTCRETLLDIFEVDGDFRHQQVTEEDRDNILNPLLQHVGSVVQGAQLAWKNRSKVIVPDGGRHHASKNLSQGGCVFSDVPLAILKLRQSNPATQSMKFLYIDTDVHHCNGFARSRFELGKVLPFQGSFLSSKRRLTKKVTRDARLFLHHGLVQRGYLALFP
jgi:acetoin utilization deacetylase AcuC-like enzyme